MSRRAWGAGAAGAAALLLFPMVAPGDWVNEALFILYFSYLGQCWNILGGYAGQASLGHAAFFGIGAYTAAALHLHAGLSPFLGMWVGAALAAALSLLVGVLSFRFGLRGSYFLLMTLAFAEITRLVALHLDLLGGFQGLFIPFREDPVNFQFGSVTPYYYAALALAAFGCVVVLGLERSRLGKALMAIREDEDAAEALGVDAYRVKLQAFALSAALTALGGTFYAYRILHLHPDPVLGVEQSVEIILRPIIGGSGTVAGPVVGALLLGVLGALSRRVIPIGGYAGAQLILYGVLLVAVVLFMPQGASPVLARRLRGSRP